MSFDLFVFERRNSIKTSLDVFSYQEEFTEYTEDKDYNSLNDVLILSPLGRKKCLRNFHR